MQPFLEKIVKHLYERYGDKISDVCIVLPNRRAGLFLKKYLAKEIHQPIWLPEIFSIEDFIAQLSDLRVLDSVDLLFEFYEVYKELNPETAEPFDAFAKWASMLLNDFNEADLYLVDEKKFFTNLRDIKEVENWSFNSAELTELQTKYLNFWDSMGDYYCALSSRLLSKKQANQGLVYRTVAENILERVEGKSWQKIIFSGFNALSAAEEKIISTLIKAAKAEVLWDADVYYTDDKNQEAGKFIRKYKKAFSPEKKEFLWEENNLSTDNKNIQIIGAPGNVNQAKTAGSILSSLQKKNEDIEKTAVVLADERLLFPVLNSLPATIENMNVTMGYKLNNTTVVDFFTIVFDLHENARHFKESGDNYKFHHKDVVKFFNHTYTYILCSTEDASYLPFEIVNNILSGNQVFLSATEIEKALNNELKASPFKLVFEHWKNVDEAIECLNNLINELKLRLIDSAAEEGSEKINLESEFLISYSKIINRIQALCAEYKSIAEIKMLRKIIAQLVSSSSLPFYGEPLNGLQIMGMLETRMLDFENVVLLSANENILPEAKTKSSFIPFDLRKAFGLPTYTDRDAIYAYHFYRLVQRAKNVFILYNTETDVFGKGEKSRFVTQLVYELPKVNKQVKIEEKILDLEIKLPEFGNAIVIEKTKDIFEKLDVKAQEGFSPSFLNAYRNCSLQFYFRYVARIREEEEIEEFIGADTLGNVIHKVLEKLYTPFIGKNVTALDIDRMKKTADEETKKAFEEMYNKNDLLYGKNLLIQKVAEKFIQGFLSREAEYIKENKEDLFIKVIEEELNAEVVIEAIEKKIKIKGKIDRIDGFGNTTRIIDYKTGSVDDKELKIKEWDSLADVKLNKSFQLLMYGLLYNKVNLERKENLQSGIISFRKLSEGLKKVKVNDLDYLDETTLQTFEEQLKKLITEIYNPQIPFSQTKDLTICEYCSFKMICNR